MTKAFEFDPPEVVLLERICRQLDVIAQLEEIVAAEGPLKAGKAHPAAVEARQQSLVLTRLYKALALPKDEVVEQLTATQRHARRAAQARWSRQRLREASGGQ